MPAKEFWKFWPVVVLDAVVLAVSAVLCLAFDLRAFFVVLAAALVVAGFSFFMTKRIQADVFALITRMAKSLDAADKETLLSFPIPALVTSVSGEVLWYNEDFRKSVLSGKDSFGMMLADIAPALKIKDFSANGGGRAEVPLAQKRYTVYGNKLHGDFYAFYWIDETELKNTSDEYKLSRPAVAILMIDNYDELVQNAREGEKTEIIGLVEKLLVNWVSKTTGFLRHTDSDKYIFVLEERHLEEIVKRRFDILDSVRQIVSGDRMPATLSIGVGRGGDTFAENEDMARQALDMALGRGGDQAAVKTRRGFEFYGGLSKAVEKRTKVRTRIIASALSELIDGSDNVLIMGHKNSDLDVVGSAAAMCKAVMARGRDAKIVLNRRSCLANALVSRLEENGYRDVFINIDEAEGFLLRRTLLIVVDTHRQVMTEYPELLKMVKTVVVIDHHRKMVDFIDNAVVFYHEPFSSSTAEMVSELVQYVADQAVTNVEADAMLAGITLDSRNFTVRTGVRTFEAAAYLRRKGADTARVRMLFSGTLDSYNKRAKIVESAQVYKKCAIAVCADKDDAVRLVAPQAADELLTISGISASFVIYLCPGGASVSARSMGGVNVQLIMESIGGGGHQAMAAAQFTGLALPQVRQKVVDAIDQYFGVNKQQT